MDVDGSGIASAGYGFAEVVEGGEGEELEVGLTDYYEVVTDGFDG